MKKRYSIVLTGAIPVVCALAFVAFKTSFDNRQRYDFEAPSAQELAGLSAVKRGEYLARAGDCIACHTAPQGKPYAGGLKIETPFGTIVSTNITPDPTHGIGRWTENEFIRAVRQGKRPNGENLYPAMPYNVYVKVSDQDLKDIKTYLDTIPPVADQTEATQLPFPFNQRWLMSGWNLIFFNPIPFKNDPKQSVVWNRGSYLVNGLGHCTSCHTPKNSLGADSWGRKFQGGELQGWYAPEITGNSHVGIGDWSNDQIVQYLQTGSNTYSVASGPMGEAVNYSLQYMSKSDLNAIAEYLKSLPGSPPIKQRFIVSDEAMIRGQMVYETQCMACHSANGEGVESMIPAFAGSSLVQSEDPSTLMRVVFLGNQGAITEKNPTGATMPSFAWKLSDKQIADVLTYIRNAWGNQAAPVITDHVTKARNSIGAEKALNNTEYVNDNAK